MHLPRIGRSFGWNWLVFSLVLTGLTLVWSVAMPLPSGPDETAHYIEAAAVVRGQVAGSQVPGHAGIVRVRVPAAISRQGAGRTCYYRPRYANAACDRTAPPAPHGTVDAATYVGNYPPLYYALTGWPSLISTSRVGLRTIRGMSALLGSILLGLAFATARRWSENRLLPLALGVALTPAVVYLNSVLNPSGFEISAAAVLWTAAAVLILERDGDPPPGLVAVTTVSAVLLALTRPLSPVFVLLILGALVVLRPRRCGRLLRARSIRIGAALIVVAELVAAIFVVIHYSYVIEHFPLPPGLGRAEIVRLSVQHAGSVTRQLFGAYGSPDFGSPFLVQVLWGGSATLLLGVALLLLPRGDALLLAAGMLVILVALPLASDLTGARTRGLIWQARYELPLAVGLPLLAAGLLAGRRLHPGRAHLLGPGVVGLGLLVAYFWVVRRYQLGLFGPLNPFPSGPNVWQPPVPGVLLFVLAAALSAGYAGLLWGSSRPLPPPEAAEPGAAGTTTGSATA